MVWRLKSTSKTYLDDVQGLVDGGLGVEGESGINLGGDLAGDDGENLLAELNQQAVESSVDLVVEVTALALGVVDGDIYQLGVLGLLGGSQDERGVGGGILRLVLGNGCENASPGQLVLRSNSSRERGDQIALLLLLLIPAKKQP